MRTYRIYRLKQKKLIRIVATFLIKKGLLCTDAVILDNIIIPKEHDTPDMYDKLQSVCKNINNVDVTWLPTCVINFGFGLQMSKIQVDNVEIYDMEVISL